MAELHSFTAVPSAHRTGPTSYKCSHFVVPVLSRVSTWRDEGHVADDSACNLVTAAATVESLSVLRSTSLVSTETAPLCSSTERWTLSDRSIATTAEGQ